MKTLAIDIETQSSVQLAKTGVYKYAQQADFKILLFAYSTDEQPVKIVDLANWETIPAPIIDALFDPRIIKTAFNANFERICLSEYLHSTHPGRLPVGAYLPADGWECTMVRALYNGLPGSLKHAALALGLPAQKDTAGTRLINKFSNHPGIACAGADWEAFKNYCAQDVRVEQAIRASTVPIPPIEQANYLVDQAICDRGVRVDRVLAEKAIEIDAELKNNTLGEAQKITGIENPNSPIQLLAWLKTQGVNADSLTKSKVTELLTTPGLSETVRRVLKLRQRAALTSTKKYETGLAIASDVDGRARGITQFYGAARTGRWAGRLLQVQNLPRNYLAQLDTARHLVKTGDQDALSMLFPPAEDALKQLIRTMLIPGEGKKFIVADYSAIEARVIAWLAGEQWVLDTFTQGGDIYCATAAQMFHVPVEKHGPNAHLRQKGKVATLACGYQGGVGALKAMGADRMGLTETEMQQIVTAWRKANPKIVALWADCGKTAMKAVTNPHKAVKTLNRKLEFYHDTETLTIKLPSGRELYYQQFTLSAQGFSYYAQNTTRPWAKTTTYGGKLTENIVQAIARDILANALRNVETHPAFQTVMHVHDEIVAETTLPATEGEKKLGALMTRLPDWAQDLPLTAEAYTCNYYRKD